MLSVIDYNVWGGSPVGFHITNTALHGVAAVLVYFVAAAILGYGLGPMIVALLFAVHPIHTEAVSYIAGRTDVTLGIFFLLSLLLYIGFRRSAGRAGHVLYAGSVLAFILALFSKEAAVALPLVLLLYDVYFRSGGTGLSLSKRLLPPLGPPLAIGLVYIVAGATTGLGEAFTVNRIGIGLQALTAVRALHRYVHQLLIPVNLSFAPDFPWSESFLQPHALFPLVSVLLLLIIVFVTYRRSKAISFGLAWIVITILPVSNLFAVTRFPVPLMAERYLYVPSIGFSIAVGTAVYSLVRRPGGVAGRGLVRGIGLATLGCLLAGYSSLTVARNRDWQSQYSLAAKTLEQNPKAFEARLVLAESYCDRGLHDKAVSEFRQALLENPSSARAYLGLGIALGEMDEYRAAVSYIKQAIALDPQLADAYHSLGVMYCNIGRTPEGIEQYHKALALIPSSAKVHNSLGNARLKSGDLDQAISSYRTALKINPDLLGARLNLAHALTGKGRAEEAISECTKALEAAPEWGRAHGCLGNAYMAAGSIDKAFSEYEQALANDPGLAWVHVSLAYIYRFKGDYESARASCEKAMERGVAVDPEFLESLRPLGREAP
jgi:tetratricopeptide (TPR) repeat protein